MTFSGDYGVYHSMYDDYYWMSHFGDPGMQYTATLAKIWAHMVIDLACSPLIPLDYETCARELKGYLEDWADLYDPSRKRTKDLFLLIGEMEKKASALTPYLIGKKSGIGHIPEERIRNANQLLIQIERDFTDPEGIPNRDWFKHLVFGARYTYAVLLFPALTEAAEAGDKDGVNQSLRDLEESMKKVILKLEEISKLLTTE
jgi:N-acetylated-alpha-linked acidic dipeptidase